MSRAPFTGIVDPDTTSWRSRVRAALLAVAIVGLAALTERVMSFAVDAPATRGLLLIVAVAIATWLGGAVAAVAAVLLGALAVATIAPRAAEGIAPDAAMFIVPALAIAALVLHARGRVQRHAQRVEDATRALGDARDAMRERDDLDEQLHAHRDWYGVTLKSIADAVVTTDARGDVQFMNATAEALTGVRADDATGRPLHEVFAARDETTGATVAPAVLASFAHDTPRSTDPVVLHARDGATRIVRYTAAPIHFHDGRLLGGVLVFRDVSRERSAEIEQRRLLVAAREAEGAAQRAQRELEGAHRMFAAFMANLPHPAFIQDLAGTLVFVNEAGQRTRGWREEPGHGHADAHAGGESADARHYFHIRFPVQVGGERMLGGIALDVTERERTERKLAERTTELETLFRNVPAPLWIARDPSAATVEGNPAARALLGRVGVGETARWRFLRDGAPVPDDELPIRRAIRERRAIEGAELELARPDGSRRHLLSTAAPLLDRDGRVGGAVAAALDISELKAYESALRRADRRKDEFLATLAHELRNPLAPIGNAVAILRRAPDDPVRVARASGVIDRQVGMMVRLIDDLLDIARISQGLVELRPARRTVGEVVDAAIEIAMPAIVGRAQRLQVVHDDASAVVRVDPMRTEQVLVNLLSNASKYSPRGTRIVVRSARSGDFCDVAVVDEGEGIDPAMLPQLFDMFTRRLDPTGHRPPGLGVGLALARRLAIQQGGRLEGRSAGPGRGATFTVSLPLDATAPADDRSTAEDADSLPPGAARPPVLRSTISPPPTLR